MLGGIRKEDSGNQAEVVPDLLLGGKVAVRYGSLRYPESGDQCQGGYQKCQVVVGVKQNMTVFLQRGKISAQRPIYCLDTKGNTTCQKFQVSLNQSFCPLLMQLDA